MDFTLKRYEELLTTLKGGGFVFLTFREFTEGTAEKIVVLRHDVDLVPENALITAMIEHSLGIKGTYYFRIVPESFDENVIKNIYDLGHEVGYHYENMDAVARKLKCNLRGSFNGFALEDHFDAAWEDFKLNLKKIRRIAPVNTIAMHGSPRSCFNNLDLWKYYDYRQLGIIGEPYMDVDFSDVFYLTDTGRRWNGSSVSVRDRVKSGINAKHLQFNSTRDIIDAARLGVLPSRIMINLHPQRWTNSFIPWAKELVWQNVKNIVKSYMISRNCRKR